ncbi:hypothetical protein [Gracilimonas sp.]|uniref:hypothetical protein n=1 Tax=Gracilimonas sp. TaxID=1974203 RepID=UPI003BA9FA2F
MSATAQLFLENEILLASDGAEWDFITGKETNLNTNKNHKINESISIVWIGSMYFLMHIIKKRTKDLRTVKEVAVVTGNILKEFVPKFLEHFPEKNPDYLYAITVLGYDYTGERKLYQLALLEDDKDNAYNPREIEVITNTCRAVAYDLNCYDTFTKILQEEINNTPKALEDAFKRAFIRLVDYFKEQGKQVGGELFFERVFHPKVQKILSAPRA